MKIIDSVRPGHVSFMLLLLPVFASAQSTFERSFNIQGNDFGRAVIETADGDFVIAGNTNWLSGGLEDAVILKTDACGELQWLRVYGGVQAEELNDIVLLSDGGYVLAGYSASFGGGNNVYVTRTNSNGDILWSKNIGGNLLESAERVLLTGSNTLLIAGMTQSVGAGDWDPFLLNMDMDGKIQWSRTYGTPSLENLQDADLTPNGEIILAGNWFGNVVDGDVDIGLVFTDQDGKMLWDRNISLGPSYEETFAVAATSDGGMIVTAEPEWLMDGPDFCIMKLSASGSIQWISTVYDDDPFGYSIMQTSDGGFIATGAGSRSVVRKFSSNGQLLWERSFLPESPWNLKETSDGGIVFTGLAGGSTTNIYLVKLASDGTDGCETTPSPSPEASAVVTSGSGISEFTVVFPVDDYVSTAEFFLPVTDTLLCSSGMIPYAEFSVSDTIICPEDCIDFTDLSGCGATQWQWTFAGATPPSSALQNPVNICFNSPGNYTVTLVVSNLNGSDTLIETGFISVVSSPLIDAGPDILITKGLSAQLQASGGVTYSWSPSGSLSDSTIANPVADPDTTTVYYVTAADSNGCTGTDSVIVMVVDKPDIFLPNAFTPNGDNQNDVLNAIGVGVESFEMKVYNRWGEMLFATKNINEGWKGSSGGKEHPAGVYVVHIRAVFINKQQYNDGKPVLLLR